jgi:hypothetical protein
VWLVNEKRRAESAVLAQQYWRLGSTAAGKSVIRMFKTTPGSAALGAGLGSGEGLACQRGFAEADDDDARQLGNFADGLAGDDDAFQLDGGLRRGLHGKGGESQGDCGEEGGLLAHDGLRSVGFEKRDCLFDGVSFGNEDGLFQAAAIKRWPRWMNCKRGG